MPDLDELFTHLRERVDHVTPTDPDLARTLVVQHVGTDDPDRWMSIATIAMRQALESRREVPDA